MKHSFYLLWLVISAALTVAGCDHAGHKGHDKPDEEKKEHAHGEDEILFSEEKAKAVGLTVETVQKGDFSEVVEVSGRILPAQGTEATVTATMAGIVSLPATPLTDGAPVRRGQPLFTVSAAQMADGNPAAAAKAELETAKANYERMKLLAEDRLVTARELDEARQRYETARTTTASLGGGNQTRAVTAPAGGYIKNVMVKDGDYVNAGQALATITQSRRLQLRAELPERSYNFLPQIKSASFRPAYAENATSYSLSNMNGRLVSKGQAADAADFFVPVIFEFDNVGNIVAGSYAEVYLLGNTRRNVISVPSAALTEEQGIFYVYLQHSGHSYLKQEVTCGASDGTRVEITSGLKAGDKVVTHGVTQVKLAASAGTIPEGHGHSH